MKLKILNFQQFEYLRFKDSGQYDLLTAQIVHVHHKLWYGKLTIFIV